MERSKEIGQRIKSIREKRGLTQDEVAAKLEINRATYSRYESGQNFSIDTMEKIAQALDLELEINFKEK